VPAAAGTRGPLGSAADSLRYLITGTLQMSPRLVWRARDPWPALLCAAYVYVVVLLCWRFNALLFILLALGTAMLLASQPTRRNLFLWLLSSIYGGYGEYARAHLGIWTWAQPDWVGLPIWLWWIWGTLTLSLVRLAEWTHQRLDLALSRRRLVRRVLWGVGLALAIGYWLVVLRVLPYVFGWISIVMVVVVVVCRPKWRHLTLFWITALLGLFGEASGIRAGIYAYGVPFFTFSPLLVAVPLAWGLSAVLLDGLSEQLTRCCTPPIPQGRYS